MVDRHFLPETTKSSISPSSSKDLPEPDFPPGIFDAKTRPKMKRKKVKASPEVPRAPNQAVESVAVADVNSPALSKSAGFVGGDLQGLTGAGIDSMGAAVVPLSRP